MGDTRSYLTAARHGWKTIMLASVIACVTALAVALLVPPTYESEARLLVSQPGTSIDIFGTQLTGGAVRNDNVVQTQAELLRSRTLIAEVARRLDLKVSPEVLARHIDVAPVGPTSVISIKVRDGDARRAADVANTVASVYLANSRASRQASLKAAADALAARIEGVKTELAALDASDSQDAATQRRIAADRLAKLSETLEQLRVEQQLGEGSGVVTDAAVPAAVPTGPTPPIAALGGMLAGLLLGTVLVVGQDPRRTSAEASRGDGPGEAPSDATPLRRGA